MTPQVLVPQVRGVLLFSTLWETQQKLRAASSVRAAHYTEQLTPAQRNLEHMMRCTKVGCVVCEG